MSEEPDSNSVELTIEIDGDDDVFITFAGGGQAEIVDITDGTVTIEGDEPVPTVLSGHTVEFEESYAWKAIVPKGTLDAYSDLITSVSIFN